MLFSEYQEAALETALPPARNLDYLLPGLIAEVGECFGKVAKARRDGWSNHRLNTELVKEWGDCAWFVAVALNEIGVKAASNGEALGRFSTRDEVLLDAAQYAHISGSKPDPYYPLSDLWLILRDGSEVVTAQPFGVVLEANLAKLKDRQARNVIGGSGDAR